MIPITPTLAGLVDRCRRNAVLVVLLVLAVTAGLGFYTARNLGIDTNTETLLSERLPWKQREQRLRQLFPDTKNMILVVVDGHTPELADQAAGRLAERLAEQREIFFSVRRPDGGPYFDRYGILFLSPDRLQEVIDQLIEAQPFIGTLAADPTLRGLFHGLDLAATGISRGEGEVERFNEPMEQLAESIEAELAGQHRPVSWQNLLAGSAGPEEKLRRFILAKPVLDYGRLRRGATASEAILQAAADLGLTPDRGVTVRLTGDVPLADDEFNSVSEGAGISTALSLLLVCLILWMGLRSPRIILSILATLFVGIIWTAAFATVTVGKLNLLSVAFAVLFIGLAVDFGIQFCVRYRDERYRHEDFPRALRRAALGVGGALILAAAVTAVDFYSFLPTDYRGISELGLISGTGMIFAILLNLTFLPALLTLLKPKGEPEPVGFAWAAPIDRLLLDKRRWVLTGGALLGIVCFVISFGLRFDYNPMSLKDPEAPSMQTLTDILSDPLTTPFTIDVLTGSTTEAAALAKTLAELPDVERAISIESFIPKNQEEKLDLLGELDLFLGPTLNVPTDPAPTPEEELEAARATAANLRMLGQDLPPDAPANRLAAALEALAAQPEHLPDVRAAVIGGLPDELDRLREILTLEPVTLQDLPSDLMRAWVARDGEARVQVVPRAGVVDGPALRAFVQSVQSLVPYAGGPAVSMIESGETMLRAFEIARVLAVVAVVVVLLLFLRRIGDTLRVMTPLVLAALLTLATMVIIDLPLNFANIVALPLLVGIGVAFDIYFVMNWRMGQHGPLQSPTARAVIFSAATTTAAFGSLALSPHPGTASMGLLLAIGMGYTVLVTLFFLPSLLGPPPKGAEVHGDGGLA